MQRTTALMTQWEAENKKGATLQFENCKGGYFSAKDEYGLKVVGSTKQDVLTGKNLLPPIVDGTKPIYSNLVNELADVFRRLTVGKTYFYSVAIFGGIDGGARRGSFILSGGGNRITTIQPNSSFTVTDGFSNVDTVRVYGSYSTTDLTTLSNSQLEEGLAATTYEPYCGGIPSPNTDYPQEIQCVKAGTVVSCGASTITTPCDLYEGDVWYPTSGKVEKHNTIKVFDGTENIIKNNASETNYLYWYNINDINKKPASVHKGKCTRLTLTSSVPINNEGMSIANSTAQETTIMYMNFGYISPNTAQNFKNILFEWYSNGNPMKVVYGLFTPIIEQYEPQPIFAPQETVNVTQIASGLSADLSATLLVRR